jgi:hypothetical protein
MTPCSSVGQGSTTTSWPTTGATTKLNGFSTASRRVGVRCGMSVARAYRPSALTSETIAR